MNGSILSSIYPLLQIAKCPHSELSGGKFNPTGAVETLTNEGVHIRNFLPQYNLDLVNLKVRVDLHILEVQDAEGENPSDVSKDWGEIVLSADKANRKKRSAVNIIEVREVLLDKTSRKVQTPCISSRDNDVVGYIFTLVIFMPRIISYAPNSDLSIRNRTALFATELIGVYRSFVLRFQAFLGLSQYPNLACGRLTESDYHAHAEDAYRLICHFSYFEDLAKSEGIVSEWVARIRDSGLVAFEVLRESKIPTLNDIVTDIGVAWRCVPSQVQRKLLEFAVYRTMCSKVESH